MKAEDGDGDEEVDDVRQGIPEADAAVDDLIVFLFTSIVFFIKVVVAEDCSLSSCTLLLCKKS